ncbi:MAG: 2-polyprenylphenol 6-hydroxylase [Rickettsiaceae bacterium H1]|nr:2-polyprenylphenol 6-hydroxylase [Rickettsiaceae bacterium H1]
MFVTLLRLTGLLLWLRFLPINKKSNIADKLKKMGPIFIKFGQSFASRPDIFGKEITKQLLTLCDKLEPFSFKQVKKIIECEFGKELTEVFPYFEKKPVSAASIAQVHKAYTGEGKLIAVKVLRPKIEKLFQRDIRLIKFCTVIFKPFIPKRFRIDEVIALFSENIKLELDLRFEAANADELREHTEDLEELYIPEVEWDYTTSRVLTVEWVEGTPITQFDYSPKIAEILAVSFVKQAYYEGIFHGDMHPGNILITEDEKIALVDFGIIGRLDNKTKLYVAEILIGFLQRNYKYVADIHFRAGYVSAKYNNFVTACRAIGEPIMGKRISVANLLQQLFKITADFNIPVQPQLLLLQKTILLIEGHCLRLFPEIDLWELVKPHMENWADDNLGFKRKIYNSPIFQRIESIIERCDNCHQANVNQKQSSESFFFKVIILLVLFYLILDKIL